MTAIPNPTVGLRVRDVARLHDVACVVVDEQAPMGDVLTKFVQAPWVRVLSVVDRAGELVGAIPLLFAIDYLLFRRDPIRTAGMLAFESAPEWIRRMSARTAKELALPIASVQPDEPIERGIQLMHQHRLEGLPVVDERGKVIGYLDAVRAMAACGWGGQSRRWSKPRERVSPPR